MAEARHDLTGIYKLFLRIASVGFVIDQTARMSSTYHDTGTVRVDRKPSSEATLTVEHYPGLPRPFRELVAGYIIGGLELAGARDVRVQHIDTNPDAWQWVTSWRSK